MADWNCLCIQDFSIIKNLRENKKRLNFFFLLVLLLMRISS